MTGWGQTLLIRTGDLRESTFTGILIHVVKLLSQKLTSISIGTKSMLFTLLNPITIFLKIFAYKLSKKFHLESLIPLFFLYVYWSFFIFLCVCIVDL